jgi:hypothetical protein
MAEKKRPRLPDPSVSINGHRPGEVPDQEEEPRSTLDPQALVNLLLDSPRLRRALKRDPETDDTRHGYFDVLLAETGLLAQWSEDDIIALIREGNSRSARPEPDIGYCRLVIHEARLKANLGNLDFAREALLMNLSDTWGLEIQAVVRHGRENALWHLQLHDGSEIQLGTSKELMSQAHVRARIYDVTGHVLRRYPPKDAHLWDHHMQILAQVAVTVDTPEMTRLGQAKSLVLGYLEMQSCMLDRDNSSEEWELLALGNRPFVRQGMLYLAARHMFLNYVRVVNSKMIQTDLLDLLRLLKGRRITLTVQQPKKTSRSVWRIPPASLEEVPVETVPVLPTTEPETESQQVLEKQDDTTLFDLSD